MQRQTHVSTSNVGSYVYLQAVAGDSHRRNSNDIRHAITCVLHARSGRAIVPDTKIDDHAH